MTTTPMANIPKEGSFMRARGMRTPSCGQWRRRRSGDGEWWTEVSRSNAKANGLHSESDAACNRNFQYVGGQTIGTGLISTGVLYS